MNSPSITPAYLNYVHGTAVDDLNRAFHDSAADTPFDTAYQDELTHLIDAYVASDGAGSHIAQFVEQLPHNNECAYHDALLAWHTLLQTRNVLDALLEDDAVLLQQVRDERAQTDQATDDAVRAEARRYNESLQIDERNQIGKEGAEQYDKDHTDIGYGSVLSDNTVQNSTGEVDEATITTIAADDGEPVNTIDVRLHEAPIVEGSNEESIDIVTQKELDTAFEHGKVQTITIEEPEITGAPAMVFTKAKKWLSTHIIAVSTGSREQKHYPRLVPLLQLPEDNPHYKSLETVRSAVSDVRRRFALLKFSKGKHDGPDFTGLLKHVGDDDKNDDLFDAVTGLSELLGGMQSGRKPDKPDWADSAMGDGNWQEGDGDAWNS